MFRKLKRDSVIQMDGVITETDKLLLQKDEEVQNFSLYNYDLFFKNCNNERIFLQIRRMQDMLSQMQEKLKATSRSSNSIYSDSQISLEFDNRKKDGIINV